MNRFLKSAMMVLAMAGATAAQAGTILYELEPEVSPASESEIAKGATVSLTFASTELSPLVNANAIATIQGTEISYTLPLTLKDVNTVTFTMDVPDTQEYTYEISIAKGLIGNANLAVYNKEINLTYKVTASSETKYLSYSVNPESGSIISAGSSIFIHFEAEYGVDWISENCKFVNVDTQEVITENSIGFAGEDYSTIEITVPSFLPAGEYSISFALGNFFDYANDEVFSPAINLTYTVTAGSVTPDPEELTYQVSPADGSVLTAIEYINITFTNATAITVTEGAKASINGVEYAIEKDFLNPAISVSIPQAITEAGTYMVTIPAGVVTTSDGRSNSLIMISYEIASSDFAIVYVNPSNAEPIEKFAEGSKIEAVFTNPDQIGNEITAVLYDMTGVAEGEEGEYVNQWYLNKQEGGEFLTPALAIDYLLYEGHVYDLVFQLRDAYYNIIATLVYRYEGASKDDRYTYSTTLLSSVTPKPGSVLSLKENQVTFVFDGAVEFQANQYSHFGAGGQMGGSTALTADMVAANADKTEWTITVPESVMKAYEGGFTIWAQFLGADGKTVCVPEAMESAINSQIMNSGEGEARAICASYTCYEAGVTVDVDPAEGEVTSLYKFRFTNPNESSLKQIDWSYNFSVNTIELLDANGDRVAMGASVTSESDTFTDFSDQASTWVEVTLEKEITANGEYTLVIPGGVFALGSEFNADVYRGQEVKYVIGQNNTVYDLTPASVTPANETKVEKLTQIAIAFNEPIVLNEANVRGAMMSKTANFEGTYSVAEDGTTLLFTLDTPIAEDGNYTLSVAKGTVGNLAWGESLHLDGNANDDLFYMWTVDSTLLVNELLGDAAAADVYNLQGVCVLRNASAADLKALDKGLYIINGKKVVLK